jgi:hypothetical protein
MFKFQISCNKFKLALWPRYLAIEPKDFGHRTEKMIQPFILDEKEKKIMLKIQISCNKFK